MKRVSALYRNGCRDIGELSERTGEPSGDCRRIVAWCKRNLNVGWNADVYIGFCCSEVFSLVQKLRGHHMGDPYLLRSRFTPIRGWSSSSFFFPESDCVIKWISLHWTLTYKEKGLCAWWAVVWVWECLRRVESLWERFAEELLMKYKIYARELWSCMKWDGGALVGGSTTKSSWGRNKKHR